MKFACRVDDDNSSGLTHCKRPSQSVALCAGRVEVKANVGFGQETTGIRFQPALSTYVVPAADTRAEKDDYGLSFRLTEFFRLAVIRYPSRLFSDGRRDSPKSDQQHRVHHCDL